MTKPKALFDDAMTDVSLLLESFLECHNAHRTSTIDSPPLCSAWFSVGFTTTSFLFASRNDVVSQVLFKHIFFFVLDKKYEKIKYVKKN
tara:strand:+ start:2232 stop:2498 length:267 start_codon:yes stop_codon:yes gene_type:complete